MAEPETIFLVNHALINNKGHQNALFTQTCGSSWVLRHRQRICNIEKQLVKAGQFSEEVMTPPVRLMRSEKAIAASGSMEVFVRPSRSLPHEENLRTCVRPP
jgi:hypothetical protein